MASYSSTLAARGDDGQKKVLEEQGRGWGGQMIQAGKG